MPRKPPAPPKLPGIEVWLEDIDVEHVAIHACRRFESWPRLSVWQIVRREDVRYGYRGAGAALLIEAESTTHPRWYRWAQRSLERWVQQIGRSIDSCAAVQDWNAHYAKRKAP